MTTIEALLDVHADRISFPGRTIVRRNHYDAASKEARDTLDGGALSGWERPGYMSEADDIADVTDAIADDYAAWLDSE